MLTSICMALVGLVFIATGLMKAVNTRSFVKQLEDYRVLPRLLVPFAALAFIGLELLLGVALLVRLSDWLLPAGIALLLLLTALTAWGTATGRVEECGCYGGLLLLTPRQSAALNATYIALLAAGWAGTGWSLAGPRFALWKLGAAVLAGLAAVALGWRSLRRGPLVEYGLLKQGKAWNPKWLRENAIPATEPSTFAVFLSQDCPYCKMWVPFLNIIHVQPDLPRVIGLMSLEGEARERFVAEHVIRFPITHVSRGLAGLMVTGYPTAVLVERGVIQQTWFGVMPQQYVDRIQEFYKAIAPERRPKSGFSG